MPKFCLHVLSRSALLAVPLLGSQLALSSRSEAQALPTASVPSTGFVMPEFNGQLSYAITLSQAVNFGYNGYQGNTTSTNISGDLAYLSGSETSPFSMVYSGGFLGSESSQQPKSTFQNLALSQVFRHRRNSVILNDTVSYLPQSPVTGLSGIPGVGDLGVNAIQTGNGFTGPGILTQYQRRVSNYLSGSDVYNLSGRTSIHGTGTYALQHFLGNGPLGSNNPGNYASYDSNQYGGAAGVSHEINRKNSYSVNYAYNRFTYKDQPYNFSSNSILFEYTHHFTPNLVFDGSVGPQINTSPTFTGTSTTASVLASLAYFTQRSSYSVAFTRGTNNGSGVVQGAISNSVGFTGQHQFSRNFSGAATVGYTHSSSISSLVFSPYSADSVVTGGQVNRGLRRDLSIFASYTLQRQTTNNAAFNTLAYNGLTQYLGFGITYSPRSMRLGKH